MAKKARVPKTKKASRALTPQDHDFIRQILTNPDADAPRLAYADWLEQQGEGERAEFIRCQIEAVRLPPSDPRRGEAAARADALFLAHQAEWEKLPPEVEGVVRVSCFERGFPAWARCRITDFPEYV